LDSGSLIADCASFEIGELIVVAVTDGFVLTDVLDESGVGGNGLDILVGVERDFRFPIRGTETLNQETFSGNMS
jgi:hypothetical protein